MDAREVARAVESFNRMRADAERFARYSEEVTNRWIRESQERYDAAVRKACATSSLGDQIAGFERATANLGRGQLSRINEVLTGYDLQQVQAKPPQRPQSLFGRFLDLISRRRRADPFADYLRRAHEHNAVARKRGGRRWWFEEWRRRALVLVSSGLSPGRLRAIFRSISPAAGRRRVARRPRPSGAVRRSFRERLLHVIEPHGPTTAPAPRSTYSMDGLAPSA